VKEKDSREDLKAERVCNPSFITGLQSISIALFYMFSKKKKRFLQIKSCKYLYFISKKICQKRKVNKFFIFF